MTQIGVGVIGCGYWGPKLIRNFHELADTNVVMVADFDRDRLNRIKQTFPAIELTTDFHDLLDSASVDAVVIATPVSTHYDLARAALNAGKHVMVEKPITASSAEAEDLLSVARSLDRRLMVGHVFEYNPAVELIKSLILDGELGDVYYIDAVRATLGLFQRDINVIWDLAPHDFSILRYLLEKDPASVSARGEAYIQPGIHDVAYITANFDGGIQAHIRVSWLEPQKKREMTIVGSKKMLVYDDTQPVEKIKIFDVGVVPEVDEFGSGQLRYRYGDIQVPRIRGVEPLQEECRHFATSIREGTEPRSNGDVGLQVVRMLEAANRSLHNQGLPSPCGAIQPAEIV
jgi:predicted dehydrogenase